MSLFHWWTLNDTVEDRCGNRDLIAWHSPSFNAGKVTKKAGKTSRGSSSNTEKTFYVSVDRTVINTSLSVSLWFNIDSDLTGGYCSPFIIGNWSAWNWEAVRFGLVYYYTNNKLVFNIANGTNYNMVDSSSVGVTLERHKWYHVAAIYEYGKGISLYINGEKIAEQSTNIFPILAGYYCIGGNDTDHYAFEGLINDVKVYDHALSSTEIKKLAQGLACHFTFNFEDFYTPVEYLESTKVQYINTNYKPILNKTKVIADAIKDIGYSIFGSGAADFTFTGSTGNNQHYAYYNGQSAVFTGENFTNRHLYIMDKNKVYIDDVYYGERTLVSSTCTYPLFIFGRSNGGSFQDGGSHKLYRLWIYEDEELIYDFIPVVRNYDHKPGLYDLVENKFYSNAGTGEFKAPYYAKVEYITGSGKCFDSKINMKPGVSCKFVFQMNNITTPQGVLGAYDGTNNANTLYVYDYNSGVSFTNHTLNGPYLPYRTADTNRHTLYFNYNSSTFDGTIDGNTLPVWNYSGNSCSVNWGIGASNRVTGTSPEDYANLKIYEFEGFYNGQKICYLVPAINLLTGAVGLYDIINNSFDEGAGSGSFSAPSINTSYMSDCSGYSIDGTGVDIENSEDTSWGNNSIVFNGTTSAFSTTCPAIDFDENGRITIAAWIKLKEGLIVDDIVGTSDWKWTFYTDNNRICFTCWDANGSHSNTLNGLICNETLENDKWYHVAMTFDGNQVIGYINGKQQETRLTRTSGSATCVKSLNLNIGGDIYTWGYRYYKGNIADVRIYATVLSEENIKELYQNRIQIDKNRTLFCGNLVEKGEIIELTKENVLKAKEFDENGLFDIETEGSYTNNSMSNSGSIKNMGLIVNQFIED